MARFAIFLAFLPLALAEIKTLDLVGYVDNCPPGAPCAPRDPVTSAKPLDIWHCNGVCTKVHLKCGLDRFEIAIETSERSILQTYALGSGDNVANGPWQSDEGQCDAGTASTPLESRMLPFNGTGRNNDRPKYTYSDISYSRCGTVKKDEPNTLDSSLTTTYFYNELDLVEFLEAKRADSNSGVIYLVSHTRVKVKCCLQDEEIIETCEPVANETLNAFHLAQCTEKSFTLSCSSDEIKETFCCNVQLATNETLGTQEVGWYVDSCQAYDINGTQGFVDLLTNGKNPNSNLQIAVGTIQDADVDKLQYTFSGPWIQFDREPVELDPHRIEVRCNVKLANKADLPAHQPGAVSDACPATSNAGSSRAGFFQAGGLSLV